MHLYRLGELNLVLLNRYFLFIHVPISFKKLNTIHWHRDLTRVYCSYILWLYLLKVDFMLYSSLSNTLSSLVASSELQDPSPIIPIARAVTLITSVVISLSLALATLSVNTSESIVITSSRHDPA